MATHSSPTPSSDALGPYGLDHHVYAVEVRRGLLCLICLLFVREAHRRLLYKLSDLEATPALGSQPGPGLGLQNADVQASEGRAA